MDENRSERPRTNPDRPRQFMMSGREVDYVLPILCTDRGQHKRRVLTEVRRELDGSGGMNRALVWFAPPMVDAKPGAMMGLKSYTFGCPSCNRTPEIGADRWWRLVDDAVRAGLAELDLSLLPS